MDLKVSADNTRMLLTPPVGAGRRIIAAVQGFRPEGSMRRHDWIFDVLSDLQDYATANGLADLAASVAVTLAVARRETAGRDGLPDPSGPNRRDRTH